MDAEESSDKAKSDAKKGTWEASLTHSESVQIIPMLAILWN